MKSPGGYWRSVPKTSADDELPFSVELCAKRAGYEVTPDDPLDVDIERAVERLEEAGFEVLTNAGILCVAQTGPVEVSVFESGRLLIKTDQEELAREATRATYDALGVRL